jgi:hypothetical protein
MPGISKAFSTTSKNGPVVTLQGTREKVQPWYYQRRHEAQAALTREQSILPYFLVLP